MKATNIGILVLVVGTMARADEASLRYFNGLLEKAQITPEMERSATGIWVGCLDTLRSKYLEVGRFGYSDHAPDRIEQESKLCFDYLRDNYRAKIEAAAAAEKLAAKKTAAAEAKSMHEAEVAELKKSPDVIVPFVSWLQCGLCQPLVLEGRKIISDEKHRATIGGIVDKAIISHGQDVVVAGEQCTGLVKKSLIAFKSKVIPCGGKKVVEVQECLEAESAKGDARCSVWLEFSNEYTRDYFHADDG